MDILISVLWTLGVAGIWLVCSGIAMAIYRIGYRWRYGEWP